MNDQSQDQLLRFGGGPDSTTLTPGTAIFVAAVIFLLFLLPRKYVVVPFLLVSLFIPYSQILVIAGLHFNIFRTLLPFAWVRVLMLGSGGAEKEFKLNGIDKAVILWACTDAVCATLLWGDWAAAVNRLGFLYNVLGIYFLLRFLIRDREDVERVVRTLAFSCVVLAGFMIMEHLTGRNVFSVFGGVPEFTVIREGKLRAQAAFAHSIIAGTVGANLFPLFVGLWWQGAKSRMIAGLGVVSALIMAVTSSSATPIGACAAGMLALCLWRYRRNLKMFRWGLVGILVALQLVMKANVWALIARIDLVGGSSGYHRYDLINQAILRIGEWFLVGTRNPSSWGYYTGDVSNAYVEAAVQGGILTLLFFLGIFWQSFRAIGLARKAAEQEQDKKLELEIWSFGAALMAIMTGYFGITYFDQSIIVWYTLLAAIGAITAVALARVPVTEETPPWARARLPVGAAVATGGASIGTARRLEPVGFSAPKSPAMGPYRRP